jgi:hypothetical protein
MGYAVYEDGGRWAGYGVPAQCDMAGCEASIDRGLDYKCETHTIWRYERGGVEIPEPEFLDEDTEEIEEEREGCGMFFCPEHQDHADHASAQQKPDSEEWVRHMLTDDSWAPWREANPQRVKEMTNEH